MLFVKMMGIRTPWRNRAQSSTLNDGAPAHKAVGTDKNTDAMTICRLVSVWRIKNPNIGAAIATAQVVAEIVRLLQSSGMPKSLDISGKTPCVE